MNTITQSLKARLKNKGSALLTVIIFIGIMLILTGSLLRYSVGERRSNERNRLILRSRNMAENVTSYASEQLTTKLRRLRSPAKVAFDSGANAIALPPSDVLTTENSAATDVEVKAGLTSATDLTFIDPKLFPNDPNKGLQVQTATVQIVAKSTMANTSTGAVTTYVEQDLAVDLTPLFQFGVFYNMDMEYGPGPDMTISGPVHTNGNLIARMQTGKTTTLEFADRVTAAGGFFANTAYKGSTWMNDDSEDKGPGGTGKLNFTPSVTSGTATPVNIWSGSVWRDHFYTANSGTATSTPGPTATNLAKFQSFATGTFNGNLRTSVHGVSKLELPAVGTYDENTNPKGGRELLEAPKAADSADLILTKIAYSAGLYIIVNPDDEQRNGTLPDGTTVAMRARSYRCWLNTFNADGTHLLKEVILPGQPSYGALNAYVNNLPNHYRSDTAIGSNQVVRMAKGWVNELPGSGYAGDAFTAPTLPTFPKLTDAYFYDMRRATNNTGHPWSRPSFNYKPRPIVKVDFDMTRFEATVDKTYFGNTQSTLYYPEFPRDAATWNASILNVDGAAAVAKLGLSPVGTTDWSVTPTIELIGSALRTQAAAYFPGKIVVTAFQQPFLGLTTNYSARWVIDEQSSPVANTPTWTNTYTSTADEPGYTITPKAGSQFVSIKMYAAGSAPSAATFIDQQIIPLISDAAPVGITSIDGLGGRFIVAETTDAAPTAAGTYTDRYVSSADEITIKYNPTTAAATAVRVRQYASGGTAVLKNEWFIPLAVATLSNDYAFVPATLGLGVFNNNTATEMRIYVGGIEDTANWDIRATPSAGVTGNWNANARFSNRYSVTGMTQDASTVLFTATRAGYPNLTKTFTLTKQTLAKNPAGAGPSTGNWFVAGGQMAPNPFGMYFAPADPAAANVTGNPAVYVVGSADLNGPWFDGITVYVHSAEAEVLTLSSGVRDRTDSGIRLINGRGTAPSLTAASRTGFTFCTNDAAYIAGNFNADGKINDDDGDSTPNGGYSARYPDTANEKLTAIMGDGVTILSQPLYTYNAGNGKYYQSTGWSDALSANRAYSTNYDASWASKNPSGSNAPDGIGSAVLPGRLPFTNHSMLNPGMGATEDTKFDPSPTEVSACVLTGIVKTTATQTSGGVHNFPRLLEYWPGTTLAIRGSMVALFESQVATEPWSIRSYQGAVRKWGLHQALRDAKHDVPLEPIVIGAHRIRYLELTPAQFDTVKAAINALH